MGKRHGEEVQRDAQSSACYQAGEAQRGWTVCREVTREEAPVAQSPVPAQGTTEGRYGGAV